ncbi:MAG TPA: SatD family protein [Anseongella sp.]|nr:SatD family protein [Anseongella sp.]
MIYIEMEAINYIAVITGDIIRSGKLKGQDREKMPGKLKSIFASLKGNAQRFSIYRGDSFQGIVTEPEQALETGLEIKAGLMKITPEYPSYDCRLAIGIGRVGFMARNALESDGEAFRNSGPALDAMNNEERLKILTPWPEVNHELHVACKLADTILKRWTAVQAGVISRALKGETQAAIAASLKISQPAVSNSLKTSGWNALEELTKRYKTLIKSHVQ